MAQRFAARGWGRRRVLGLSLAVAGVAAAALASFAGAKEPEPSPSPDTGFAGSAACAACHAKAHADWVGGNHALTCVEVKGAEIPAEATKGATVPHPPGSSVFRTKGDGATVETLGPDGKPATYDLTHVVGRRRMRMYVATLPDGRLQVLPSMKDEATGTWFDYTDLIFGVPGLPPDQAPVVKPGDASFWTGPVRSFDVRCTRCHMSGRTVIAPPAAGRGPRTAWRAVGVDCESCHGPALAHAEHWRKLPSAKGAKTPDPILSLKGLDRTRALGNCLQCHLESEVVGSDLGIAEDVLEKLDPTLLDDTERVDAFGRPMELIYEGLSFLASRCAERGALTCNDCHVPHGGPEPAMLTSPVTDDARCGRCHAAIAALPAKHTHHQASGTGARCVACHMPRVRVERGHGAVTDHTIGVPHPPDPAEGRVALDACTGCHTSARGYPPGAPTLDAAKIKTSYARLWPDAKPGPSWCRTLDAGRRGDAASAPALADLLADPAQPRVVRASAALLLGRLAGQEPAPLLDAATDPDSLVRRSAVTALAATPGPAVDAALLAALKDPAVAVRAHAARAAIEGWERVQKNPDLLKAALPALEENAQAAPDDDVRWFRLGSAKQLAGDLKGAIEAFERQVALDPFASNIREHLERLRKKVAAPPK